MVGSHLTQNFSQDKVKAWLKLVNNTSNQLVITNKTNILQSKQRAHSDISGVRSSFNICIIIVANVLILLVLLALSISPSCIPNGQNKI